MKKLIKILTFTILFVLTVGLITQVNFADTSSKNGMFKRDKIDAIESLVQSEMRKGKIPGASVAIIYGKDTAYYKGFGYSDLKSKTPVTQETLFELGSNSKAFTALGILKLKKEGLINLNDPIRKYIPWFNMIYEGKHKGEIINQKVDITIEQLLYQKSGIPFETLGKIPISKEADAIEQTVKAITGEKLDFYPGEKFQYATLNYSILGLVIEKVTGLPFEQYIKENILSPLGLENTYLYREEAEEHNLAKGYKLSYLRPMEYEAPMYGGNKPAGYFISNSVDLEKWVKIQMNEIDVNGFDVDLILESHIPDRTVAPNFDGSSYAAGWAIYQSHGGQIAHAGKNPNYSSIIIINPKEKLGIAVLTNINSEYTYTIADGIRDILADNYSSIESVDVIKKLDGITFIVICISVLLMLITMVLILKTLVEIGKGKRKAVIKGKKILSGFVTSIVLLSGFTYCLYRLPNILFNQLPWESVVVWAPKQFSVSIIMIMMTSILFCIYYAISNIFTNDDDRGYYPTILLSIVSSFGNVFIIFIINITLSMNIRVNTFGKRVIELELLIMFMMGILFYVYSQRLVRVKLINVTNSIVYQKRIELIDKLSKTSFERLETLGRGRIQAVLNNDTEVISTFANIIVNGFTSFVTLIFCFIYLSMFNLYALILSIVVISIAAGLYYIVGRFANKFWEDARDIQNTFFKHISDQIGGFKELYINNKKSKAFESEFKDSCDAYKETRTIGDLKFANVYVIGELIFTIVIGAVVFIFPALFEEIQNNSLRTYVFTFLYMTGPVHGVLNMLPNLIRYKISWNRIKKLTEEISYVENIERDFTYELNKDVLIELDKVEFKYSSENGEGFKLGPVNCEFKSGEITFITGGNGSGKTTLIKLITGLYASQSGNITVNNSSLDERRLAQGYSAVYNDFYLFEKLYGIDLESKKAEVQEYLQLLKLDNVLEIKDGIYSTTKLSSGQRKRLAMFNSLLDDRPIYVFDEWAAEQDKEFREFFYTRLLTSLKNKGKCIIAITHDDRYFHVADKIIKMDMGMISNVVDQAALLCDTKAVTY